MNQAAPSYTISASTLTALHKEVNALGSVILNNPILPILENFLFKIEDDKIVVAASDQQTSIISRVPLESKAAGTLKIAVPARILKDTLKSLPEQPVSLTTDKERYNISMQTSNGKYKIACENAEDFPNVFDFPEEKADIQLTAGVFLHAIKQTLFAVSKDDLRPELSGVFITLGSDGITFVATDGHRLVRYHRKDITSDKQVQAIVPAKSLQLLQQLLTGKSNKNIQLIFKEKQLFVAWDHIQLIISLINESYPDYENVIPRHNPHRLTLNTDCMSTLRRVAIYANRATQQLRLHISKESIKVVAEDIDFSNEAFETIPCQYEGPKMEIGFNAKLLIEMFGVLPANEDVQLALDMPNKAVLVLPPTKTDQEDVSMLIMPILLNSA